MDKTPMTGPDAGRTSRRHFLAAIAAATIVTPTLGDQTSTTRPVNKLPRWRGFNLLGLFDPKHPTPYAEADFAQIAEWGFDFVRLPTSYWCWSKPDDWGTIDEAELKPIDDAIALGKRYGIHVNLNLHRVPGYCVNPPAEPGNLWKDAAALDAATAQWRALAKRYKDVPSDRLSFDLINEPADILEADYVKVVTALVTAIREQSPDRLIVADGLKWGNQPVMGLVDLKIGQSTRGYAPMQISHAGASWIHGQEKWPAPAWPLQPGTKDAWDKARLRKTQIEPWQKLQARGVGVHVGEWGTFNHTPHDVALAWMADQLSLWADAGWGWSLWNLSGAFGVLDSGRKDVRYESFRGRKLDRKMLELLRGS